MSKQHHNWKNEVCGNCYFFEVALDYDPDGNENINICRRFPPDYKKRQGRVELKSPACAEFVEIFNRRVD
jgi:hypothetical protein